jgi:aldose 1-epimerase
LNDPARKNAIHGFACRRPWHAVRSAGQDDLATFTAEFQACADSTQELHLWPGDYRLTMRFLLTPDSLSLSATVHNPCDCPVPLGLGYHPYFSVPLAPGAPAGDCLISVPAKSIWELHENLPTGKKLPVDAAQNLRAPRRFADLQLDDLYTDLDSSSPDMVLHLLGSVHQAGIGAVELWTSGAFRELVAFTPPHREAVCLEPYTCTTDAINLQQQGIDAGLMVFEPGETRTLFVVMRFVPSSIRS